MWILWFVLSVLLLGFLWIRRRCYWLAWKLGGPIGLPFLGNLELLRPEYFLRFTSYLTKEYKTPATFWIGPMIALYVDDPESMERVYKAKECLNRSIIYKFITDIIGQGLISNNNPIWSAHRKLLNPIFSHRNLLTFFPIFNAEVDILCNKLGKFADTKEPFRIPDILQKLTMSVACQTTMGKQINFQDNSDAGVLNSYNFMIHAVSKVIFNPLYSIRCLMKFYDPKFYQNWDKSVADGMHFVNNLVFAKLSQSEQQGNITIKQDDDKVMKSESIFIDYVTNLAKKNLFSVNEVIDESNHMMLAAFETTAKALYHIILLVAMHPEWQAKLHEEIKDVFPEKKFEVFYEHLEHLPLTEMIINETLRLLPVVPLQGRRTDNDFHLRDDIIIPKGTNICLGVYAMHRNPKYWGEDAHEFNPGHFYPDAVQNRHPYAFAPFSKGPRNCLGWRYAYMNMKVILAKIFRNYRFTTTTKMEDIELMFDMVSNLNIQPVFEIYYIKD